MNAFDTLGIDTRLILSEEYLREAFREAGKRVHPDAGGEEGDFAKLREAMAIVSSPSRRLRHWLELRGETPEIRGVIGPELMDLFVEIGSATQQAETAIRKREEAKSALAKALLENDTQNSRESLEACITKVDAAMDLSCSVFPMLELDGPSAVPEAARVVRDLAFLEKWKAGLRSAYSRLI